MGAAEEALPRVMVTRPAGQADRLVTGLRNAGWQVWHLPLIDIAPMEALPGPVRQRIQDLDLYAHLVFVSANAARIGCALVDDFWPQWPVGQRYWAVGASTAQVLEERGLKAERPTTDMSSEGLLALPGLNRVAGDRVLIVRGEGGRQLIAETLRERGATVDDLCCYRRGPVEHDAAQLRESLRTAPVDLVMVSSGEGLELLSGLLQPEANSALAATPLLVPSPRVADLAVRLGWQSITTVENASDPAMLDAAAHWRAARREGTP